MPNWLSRTLSWIAAALVGAVYGTAGTIAHSLMWGIVPLGLIVGGIACGALLLAVRALTHDRAAAVATAVGMIGMLLIISGPGPGGSVVVPNTPVGQIWICLVAGIALLVIAWPNLRRRPPAPPARSSVPARASVPDGEPAHGNGP